MNDNVAEHADDLAEDDIAPEDVRDALPADLDTTAIETPYLFPNNSRRRIPGVLYILIGIGCIVLVASVVTYGIGSLFGTAIA